MRVRFQVTVSSDDDSVVQTVNSELQLATGLNGVDPSIAKQDFLAQAESLVRTIAESQLPALYQGVSDAYAAKKAKEAEAKQSNAVAAARVKLRAMKKAKKDAELANAAAGDRAQEVQNAVPAADDIVECADCGTKIEHDAAHYVTVVEDGKPKRDAVLCDACYDKVLEAQREQSGQPLEASDGGTRPETGETDDNGEAAE